MSNPFQKIRSAALSSTVGDLLWPVLALLVGASALYSSVVVIAPGQAAVKVNNLTGDLQAVTRSGFTLRLPLLQSVHVLDAAPQTFRMRDTKEQDALHVSSLTVRASDGSNFHFDDTTLVFQLKADESVAAVRDAGPGDGYLQWMRPFARSILRDEFGRESTIAVSDPTRYGEAAERAKRRLNEVLGPHGIRVTQLVTPRPRFNDAYEKAIEDRNRLGNELEVIRSNLDRAATERSRRLASVDQEQNNLLQQRRAKLQGELATASARQAQVKRESDTYRIAQIAKGQADLSAAQVRAQELKRELAAKYEGKRAEINAFRNQPVEKVMQRLGERLEGVTIEIQPFADDATPSRIRYEEMRK
jgi:membrane protease subunit HflC